MKTLHTFDVVVFRESVTATSEIFPGGLLPNDTERAVSNGSVRFHLGGAGHLARRVAEGLRYRRSSAGASSQSGGVPRGPRRGGGSGQARRGAEARGRSPAGGADAEILVTELRARKQVSTGGLPAGAVKRHPPAVPNPEPDHRAPAAGEPRSSLSRTHQLPAGRTPNTFIAAERTSPRRRCNTEPSTCDPLLQNKSTAITAFNLKTPVHGQRYTTNHKGKKQTCRTCSRNPRKIKVALRYKGNAEKRLNSHPVQNLKRSRICRNTEANKARWFLLCYETQKTQRPSRK